MYYNRNIIDGSARTGTGVIPLAMIDDARSASGGSPKNGSSTLESIIDAQTMYKLTYGLFVLTAGNGVKDNGCIINTAAQITSSPLRVSIAVNKANLTHDMILKSGTFNLSILTESAPFRIFEQFGFVSGRTTDKFEGCGYDERTINGIRYIPEHTNGVVSAVMTDAIDYGTHTLIIADVTQTITLSDAPSASYQYYFDHIKPKPVTPSKDQRGFVCKICGYVYEGDDMPDDFICPLCKHGKEDFVPV